MFNPCLSIAKLFVQYVLSYWTSQVNYTVFIKLILDFDQEWKHKPQWDQVLLLSQLFFPTLYRWEEKPRKKVKIFRFHGEGKAAECRWVLKFLKSYLGFCSGFSMVIMGLMLILNRLLTFAVTMGGSFQQMDVVCCCCSAGIWIPPSGAQGCTACLGSVEFHSSFPKRWDIWTWRAQIETWVTIPLFSLSSFSSNHW